MARFELTDKFFEDEVREGFYIPSAVKKAWGAELQVLNDVDRVCSELGIRYFATWGTFLGAVRHGGFVPWDDDLDICMLRDDYIRFIKEGVKLLPEGYEVYNHNNKADHTKFVANIVAKARICFEPEHLEKFHGFPYIAAIDLFILDYISPDENEHELIRAKSKLALKISDEIMEGRLSDDELKERLGLLEEKTGITVPSGLNRNRIRQFIDIKVEELFAYYADKKEQAEKIVQMMPCGIWDTDFYILPASYYASQENIPFEMGTIPVPIHYESAIQKHYKDYKTIYRGGGAHSYPFFDKMRSDLQEVLDFDLPEYRTDADELLERIQKRANKEDIGADSVSTYRSVVKECLVEMDRLNLKLNEAAGTVDTVNLCSDLQQTAIDLGTYMEAVKGEGYDIVSMLENYCEALYEFAQADGIKTKNAGLKNVNGLFEELRHKIMARKEVLFLPFKGEYWNSFEAEYNRVVNDPDMDVYVVPIPYYYKDYKGQLYDMQYDQSKYPKEIKVTHYDDYDYVLRHPDTIYFQNPYDEWNEVTTVPPFFYSERLLEYTDELIYIPWFKTYDFTREDVKAYTDMRYYCTVPGVVNADKVILRSEIIRNTYIDKLSEFAGYNTREIWEKKLTVAF